MGTVHCVYLGAPRNRSFFVFPLLFLLSFPSPMLPTFASISLLLLLCALGGHQEETRKRIEEKAGRERRNRRWFACFALHKRSVVTILSRFACIFLVFYLVHFYEPSTNKKENRREGRVVEGGGGNS